VDKVRITPKKKVLKITIDRELVVTPKKKKGKKGEETPAVNAGTGTPAAPATELSDADQAKAEMNAAPEAERPADSASVTTTTSPAHAAHLMRDAIDHIFAQGLDDRMIAAMPSFWKLYYQAVANQADYKPTDPAIYRQSGVDQKAKLLSTIEPPSNEYAQANGVAGMALYHAVIGADGKPQEIVVSRPIGFGLDESAADSIRKASFQPATKDGKNVPVVLDVVVQFRIYSKRTNQPAKPDTEAANAGPKLPGPYSVNHQ
jgi:TonB family protein